MTQIKHPAQQLAIGGMPVADLSLAATTETGALVEESCWQLTPEELEQVQATGCVFLVVVRHGEHTTILPGAAPVVEITGRE